MDAFDREILNLVQEDNQQSHERIGELVGLSASAVRRRLKVMNKNGVIIANVAVTDITKIGLTFIVSVTFQKETPLAYDAFRKQMKEEHCVSQCYSVSGEFDFILTVHASSPRAFELWGERELMSNPLIGRYTTSIVWSQTKFTTKISPVSEV